jgi:hypothetical protein
MGLLRFARSKNAALPGGIFPALAQGCSSSKPQ